MDSYLDPFGQVTLCEAVFKRILEIISGIVVVFVAAM